MEKKEYVIPGIWIENIETEQMIAKVSQTDPETTNQAPDNKEQHGQGLGGSNGDDEIPTEAGAKGTGGFIFWKGTWSFDDDDL